MHARPSVSNSNTGSLSQFILRIAPYLVIASIVVVVVATLFPFNFSREAGGSLWNFFGNFKSSSYLSDKIKNVLLFVPFGFSLACWLQTRKLSFLLKIFLATALSLSLSFTVEALQIFLPSREPTPADLVYNTLGGFVGVSCFYLWKNKVISYIINLVEKHKNQVGFQVVAVIFLCYLALPILLAFSWQNANNLSNWNLNYPLMLGNERTGDRPWKGYISEAAFADKAFSATEIEQIFAARNWWQKTNLPLLGNYQLDSQDYSDRTGNLPNLSWRRRSTITLDNRGVFLSDRHWLQTDTSVNSLNQRLQATSQFTIVTTIATAKLQQKGPARIISLSNSSSRRNFTLGQQDNKLSLRLRTPINGINAQYLNTSIDDFFTDTEIHKIVVTYANSGFHVYVDSLQNKYGVNLLQVLPEEDKIIYYGLIFLPLGLILALVITLAKKRLVRYALFYAGVLLPALLVEIVLATSSGRSFQFANILLGILITATITLGLKLQLPLWLKNTVLNYINNKS